MGKEGNKITALLVSLLGSYLVTLPALLLLAFLLYQFKLGDQTAQIGVIVIYLGATFFGGCLTGRKLHTRKYLWGMFSGAMYFAILCAVSICMPVETSQMGSGFISALLLCVAGGTLGGMFG